MKTDALYIAYWSLRDPLTQSQVLPVLRGIADRGRRIALLTFEQEAWSTTQAEKTQLTAELATHGILWTPLRYHRRPRILASLVDILIGVVVATGIVLRQGVRVVHGRGTVAAAMAFLVATLCARRFFNDADGPLSEEYVDAGVWARGSLGHRLTAFSEGLFLSTADAVAVLSEPRRRQVAPRARRPVWVLPCAVDASHFQFDAGARQRYREELGLCGTVLVYAGKTRGWYLTEEMLDFVESARAELGDVRLLVLTNEAPETFARGAAARGIPAVIRRGERSEMPSLLSAADAGLSFVLPSPSKAACSPIKNGEYLACGLPIVTTPGIGDYSDLVRREAVGVVVDDLTPPGYRRAARDLRGLLHDQGLSARCRRVALEQVGLREVVLPRYLDIYDDLLSPLGGAG